MDTSWHPAAGERLCLLYRHIPAVLAANLLNTGLVVVGLWGRTPGPPLIAWGLALAVLTVIAIADWWRYRSSRGSYPRIAAWARHFTATAAVAGLLWGTAAVLFLHYGDPFAVQLISFVIGGMAAGSVIGLAPHQRAFYAFFPTPLLLLAVRLLAEGTRTTFAMAGMVAVYAACLAVIAQNFSSSLTRRIQLSHENQDLLAHMEDEVRQRTADLQAANASLAAEIAERKEIEKALIEARAEADRANQAKSRFLAAASHDLRQPMQAMFLFAHTLRRQMGERPEVKTLSMLERGLDILKDLLDSLLDISRLDVNTVRPEVTTFAVSPLLDDIASAYAPVGAAKGLAVRVRGNCAGIHIRSDPVLLGRMVRNLMENAIRYTERGHITLTHRVSGHSLWIEVVDTGIGIPPDELGRIFEEFHQVGELDRDRARGLGLGLAIVKRLSAILDHCVQVASQPGKGSAFSIKVPIVTAAQDQIPGAGDYVRL